MPPFARRVGRPGLIGLAARTAVVAGTANAVTGSMQRKQMSRAQEQADAAAYQQQQQAAALAAQMPAAAPAPAPSPAGAAGEDLVSRIAQLAQLHEAGALSDSEFAAAKAQLLS